MSKLNIIEVNIEDSLGQLARTCTLTLAPDSPDNPPVAEFGKPGDDPRNCATSIRPSGVFIDITAGYNGVPPHVIFSGAIEYMDDLEDPDALTYKIILSEVPRGFPHKQKRSAVWNMGSKAEDLGWEATSAHTVLSTICAKAGIGLGRCDFPDYAIWGTYEAIQQSPIEVAQALYGPFNQSEHCKFFTRVDRNGLHVIKVNYEKNDASARTYEPSHLLERQSSYQVFIPERSADGDVLLTGADKYTNQVDVYGRWQVECTHTYHEDSTERTNGVGLTRSVEKYSEFKFDVELTINKETVGNNTVIDIPAIPRGDIDNVIQAVKDGDFDSCTILNSLCWHVTEYTYGPVRNSVQLITEKETFVDYQKRLFKGDGSVDTSFMDTEKTVAVYDESVESHMCGDGMAPTHMTRNWYSYDEIGNGSATVTAEYYYCRGWHLAKVSVQAGETVGVTNAQIQFYLNAWNSFNNPPDQTLPKQGTRFTSQKTPLCKYMLLNGGKLEPLIIPKPKGHQSFIISEEYWTSLRRSRSALQVSGPGMDYDGLALIWAYMQAALKYQTGNYYWHIAQGTYSLDTTPVVGETFRVAGVNGICESYKHIINADEAVTKVVLKRLTNG